VLRGTHRRNDPARGHSGQQQVGWYLPNNVADGPDRSTSHKLLAVHIEVFLHAAEKSVVDIVLVQIFKKVADLEKVLC
jgi:hypothetical protein